MPKGSDKEEDDDEEGQGEVDDNDAGHDADTGHDANVMRMLEREREDRADFYKSKDSLNNDNVFSLFGSQFSITCCRAASPFVVLPVQPLAGPPLPSLVAPPSLSLRCASLVLVGCCIASSLVAPPSLLRRLVVELPPLSPHRRLSLSRFASLPQRRRCRPTQFAATGLPPPLSRRRPQFEPADPPPPPGHIHIVDVDVIDNDIIQPPHDHRELPHRAVQSKAGITDGRRAVMPRRHRDAQFLKQHPGSQSNAGPCPSSCRYHPRCYHLRRRCCRLHWLLLRRPGSTPRQWDADRI